MHLNNLKSVLKGEFNLIDEVNWPIESAYGDKVIITPDNVRKMLKRYLQKDISEETLVNWAGFICTRDEFESEMPPMVDEDFYEDMWNVISYLSTPEIDGEITDILVSQYMVMLNKYE